MNERDRQLEDRMTPEERQLYELYRSWIGKEFDQAQALPEMSDHIEYSALINGYGPEVTWAGIKRWAVVNEDYNGLWFDEEYAARSDFGGITAPPLFLIAIDDAMAPSAWPASKVYNMQTGIVDTEKYPNFVGGLQANNDWEFFEPVRRGDTITVKARCTDAFWKQGKEFRLLFTSGETDYLNQQGETVARCRAGAVYRFR